MTISKLDLCKPEWLELVFAKRNKEYGAYYLRQHYAENIIKAMAITFISVITIFVTAGILIKVKPAEVVAATVVPLIQPVQPPPVEPKREIPKAKPSAPKELVRTIKFVTPVVTSEPVKVEPPRLDVMKEGEIGPVKIDVKGTGTTPSISEETGTGVDKAPAKDIIYTSGGVEVNPEPFGGAAAWAKFLQKNLRYPGEAVDKGISGKVFVSFIVEKDGHLSTFIIIRGVGYGMDEESLRVLKKAPAWKPGLQNGQAVRVKYTLPLNFVLNTEN
jgi:protein TonB